MQPPKDAQITPNNQIVNQLDNQTKQQQNERVIVCHRNPLQPNKKHFKKLMPHSKRNRLKLFYVSKENKKFSNYLPLHELWKKYIEDLIEGQK